MNTLLAIVRTGGLRANWMAGQIARGGARCFARQVSDDLAEKCAIALTVAGLLCSAGCGVLDREEDGDQEPTLGEYRVSLSPSHLTFDHDQAGTITTEINLSVACAGENLADCSTHNPQWRVTYGAGAKEPRNGATGVVLDPSKATTTATIQVTPSLVKLSEGGGSRVITTVQFTPVAPAGLTVTGRRGVDIVVLFPQPGGERTETPPETPRLSAYPNPMIVTHSRSGTPESGFIVCSYKGPATEIFSIILSGRNAAKFNLSRPTLPIAVEGATAFTIDVTFLGATDEATYDADVTIIAANNVTLTIPITVTPD